MKSKTTAARRRLELITENLNSALGDPEGDWVSLPKADAEFLLQAFQRFFSGSVSSVDEALGVKRGRGRPKPAPHDGMVAVAIDVISRGEQSWNDLSNKYSRDKRDLQKIAERHFDAAAESMAQELKGRLARRRGSDGKR